VALRFHPPEMIVDVLPFREMGGKHTPLAACFVQIKNGVDDFAPVVNRHGPSWIGLVHQMLDRFPLLVSQIGRVAHAGKIPANN
jgi:hypothetical protein